MNDNFKGNEKHTPLVSTSSSRDSKRWSHSPDGNELRTRSFDESDGYDASQQYRRSSSMNSGTSAIGTCSSQNQYHSSHHSTAPLSSRYEYGSTAGTDLLESSLRPFSVFNPTAQNKSPYRLLPGSEQLVKLNSEGSDEEKQSLFQMNGGGVQSNLSLDRDKSISRTNSKKSKKPNEFMFNIIYALLNATMSVPSLYGYASVIFNNAAFQPHISTLSKVVIWSSAVHQLTFVAFSSLSFAKAEVQDAGLLFLSCMSNFIAETITNEGGGIEEILSTTIVTLGVATASLGLVLMFLGKFNCADAVSYLPLPVVGGYLAFIGYFCVIAGVGLCISTSMVDGGFVSDMQLLMDKKSLLLAAPGLLSGLLMMLISRFTKSDAALPITMVAIPATFYAVLFFFGYSLDDARAGMWVGEVQPSASVSSLLELIDFSLVRWDLVFSSRCLSVWIGMVFVVSFSSCLDVGKQSPRLLSILKLIKLLAFISLCFFFTALHELLPAAISMDMGEALDVNKELVTVGLSNRELFPLYNQCILSFTLFSPTNGSSIVVSGLFGGQSGSYIFSQTILQYRTGEFIDSLGYHQNDQHCRVVAHIRKLSSSSQATCRVG